MVFLFKKELVVHMFMLLRRLVMVVFYRSKDFHGTCSTYEFFFLNFNDSFLNHLFDKEHPKDKDIING
jgi:hypothetical protein